MKYKILQAIGCLIIRWCIFMLPVSEALMKLSIKFSVVCIKIRYKVKGLFNKWE